MSEENKVQQEELSQNATESTPELQKISELESKVTDINDKLLRTLAELDNVRRRSREELEKTSKYAISGFAADLVLVVENFFLACENAPKEKIAENQEVQHFADAIEMTKKELIKILEKNKINRIFPINEKFNHDFHEAIVHVESDKEEGLVVQVVQAGYTIGDRLIRPALVGVAKSAAN